MKKEALVKLKPLNASDAEGVIEFWPGQELAVFGGSESNFGGIIKEFVDNVLDRSDSSATYEIDCKFDRSRAGALGVLFDDASWSFCNLFVNEEIAFVLENTGVPSAKMASMVQDVLDVVGLPGFERRKISTLSGGELRRVAIASILAGRPNLILSDDLNGHLDLAALDHLEAVLNEYVRDNNACWIDFRRRWSEFSAPPGSFATMGRNNIVMHQSDVKFPVDAGVDEPFGVELAKHISSELHEDVPHFPSARVAVDWLCENQIQLVSRAPERFAGEEYVAVRSLGFGFQKSLPILRELNLEFKAGRVYALGGRNGAGKSTLARLLCGLIKPDHGRIEIRGCIAPRSLLNKTSALVFQKPEYQFVTDSVADELSVALADSDLKSTKSKIAEAAERFGISHLLARHPFSLGIGEKRRLAVACAIASNRKLIIVDEPTLGQDESQTRMLGSQLRIAAADGCAIMVITHDSEFIAGYCDDVLWLEGGAISELGHPEQAFASSSKSTFSGRSHLLTIWELAAIEQIAYGRAPRLLEDLQVQR